MNKHMPYPESFPFECLKELISLLKSGKLLERRSESAKHIWTLLGFIFKVTFGEPEHPILLDSTDEMDDGIKLLEQLSDSYAATGTGTGLVLDVDSVPWPLIVSFLLTLLKIILKKRRRLED